MNDPLHAIQTHFDDLRPSEQKVASFVLKNPQNCINSSIADLARQVNVSEPTIIRFCKAIGCLGYQEFKLKLAHGIGSDNADNSRFAEFKLDNKDSLADVSNKVFDASIREILRVKKSINHSILEKAIKSIVSARRVEFFGFGASGTVAQDAQHKFMRLKTLTFASSDPHMQLISTSTMTSQDVVIAISQSGRSRELIQSVKQARKSKAKVIGICADHTPLAEQCDYPLSIESKEDTTVFTPLSSRIAHLAVIDLLATGVAIHRGPELNKHLRKIKKSLKASRVNDKPEL